MNKPNTIDAIRLMLQSQKIHGIVPAEIHMNRITRDSLLTTTRSTQSFFGRMLRPIIRGGKFDGVPLVENSDVPNGVYLVRTAEMMYDPEWARKIQWQVAQQVAPAPQKQPALPPVGTPWHQSLPQPVDEALEGKAVDGGGVLRELSKTDTANPTSIIMKALDGIDNVQNVVVLRFYKNGDIDMASSLDRYGVVGGLQAALGYVARGEGQ